MFKVKIKTWNQMEKEFGLYNFGEAINSDIVFLKKMEDSLPKNRIIFLNEDFIYKKYMYSKDMIENLFIMQNIWNNIKEN